MIVRSILALGFAALLYAPAAANPTPNPNTCIASAPNGSTLTVYDQPNTSSAVLGGIGVGQCGLFVTNQCEPGWCVIVFQTLNGWVQMQHISGSDVQPPPGQGGSATNSSGGTNVTRRFEITGGSGSVTMAGISQPTPVDPGGVIAFAVLDDSNGRLDFPTEMPLGSPAMKREQGNVWVGGFSDWVGIPTQGRIRLERLATPTPVLTLGGNIPGGRFEMSLNLRPLDGNGTNVTPQPSPPRPAPQPAPVPRPAPGPAQGQPAACDELDALEQQILPFSGPDEVQAIRAIGILNNVVGLQANRTEANCRAAIDEMLTNPELQDVLQQAGVIQSPSSTLGPISNDSLFCDQLEDIVIAIQQSGDSWLQGLLNQIQDEAGVDDLFAATAVQCEEMLRLLAQEGIDSAARVREVAQQGNQPTPPAPAPAPNPQTGPACRQVNVIAQAVDAVNHPRVTEIFDSSVQSVPIANLATATEAQCQALMQLLEMEGFGTVQGVRDLAASFRQQTQVPPTPAPIASPCRVLSTSIRPILSGRDQSLRGRVITILRGNGVVNVLQARASVCTVIITELVAANIIVAPVVPPSTVVVVPGPLRPHPSDFIPEPAPAPTPVPPAQADNCLTLGDLMIAVLDRGNSRELINMADVLASSGIDRLTGKTQAECGQALIASQRAGIQP